MFCWKGLLYYKWVLAESLPGVHGVLKALATVEPQADAAADKLAMFSRNRVSLQGAVARAAAIVKETVGVYDSAYAKLTRFGRAQAFREFLLDAPRLFEALGASLGALSHIHSFWRYRFPPGTPVLASVEELLGIVADFEGGFAPRDPSSAMRPQRQSA